MGFVTVGTAGHIDHGKTVLVKALSGIDTDRLKEEKERGISIELGFAPLTLPDGQVVGLVDVPGHERFIRQMLAGVGGIDLVLLVVAADEGVRLQTREHLAIVDLLKVQGGVIVVTKKDLVAPDWLELVVQDIRDTVRGTVLEEAPLVTVSAITGEGLDELLLLLGRQTAAVTPRETAGAGRLPLDRVFTIRGFGTVVTGTLRSGSFHQDQAVEVLPQGLACRIRQLQVHGSTVAEALAGQRVACNLAGVEVGQIGRGSELVQSGAFRATRRLDVSLSLLAAASRELKHSQRIRFCLGTAEVLGRVLLLDREELLPGETALAQVILEEQLVAARLDRFVLRSYSPVGTIGGGLVADPYAFRHRRRQSSVINEIESKLAATPAERLLQSVERRPWGLSLAEAAVLAGLEVKEAQDIARNLEETGRILTVVNEGGRHLLSAGQTAAWREDVLRTLNDFHQNFPLRRGMPREELRTRRFPTMPTKVFSALIDRGQADGILLDSGGIVSLSSFVVNLSPQQAQDLAAISVAFSRAGWQPPGLEEVLRQLGLDTAEGRELVRYLLQEGILIRVAEDLYFSQDAVVAAKDKVADLIARKGSAELADVRDALDSSRKYVLPLMEFFDQIHFTRRVADKRVSYGGGL